jgi:hypothetical protein
MVDHPESAFSGTSHFDWLATLPISSARWSFVPSHAQCPFLTVFSTRSDQPIDCNDRGEEPVVLAALVVGSAVGTLDGLIVGRFDLAARNRGPTRACELSLVPCRSKRALGPDRSGSWCDRQLFGIAEEGHDQFSSAGASCIISRPSPPRCATIFSVERSRHRAALPLHLSRHLTGVILLVEGNCRADPREQPKSATAVSW